ncbi:hypothetical protein E4U43_004892 [Claviceps pusilla]|uniref:Uncharacterized protein n=1 Tax=Claviceps pusilla TaxID=123648 RepID=A0A9P7STN8_9HYPO|nr:hypothetical protein E4U43_004892 [Claviceps pusilla]
MTPAGLPGLHGTFEDGLRWISETPHIYDLPHCVLLLGLTIGNFSRTNVGARLPGQYCQPSTPRGIQGPELYLHEP